MTPLRVIKFKHSDLDIVVLSSAATLAADAFVGTGVLNLGLYNGVVHSVAAWRAVKEEKAIGSGILVNSDVLDAVKNVKSSHGLA